MVKAIILAGGSGHRLWPLSRSAFPKQFHSLDGDKSMLQQTILRISYLPFIDPSNSITVCNAEHRFFVADQLRELGALGKIIVEPEGRNTAPAITIAALSEKDNDPLMLVMPADHVIRDKIAFADAIAKAITVAEEGKLVSFGIVPNSPHTGYGYIKAGEQVNNAFSILSFKEKPSNDIAVKYLSEGGYYWNSGIYLFRSSVYLDELKLYRPDILHACEKTYDLMSTDLDFLRLDEEAFLQCPYDSIDFAVMEKTANAVVVPMNAGWSDIGSWSSLWDVSEKDDEGNVIHGDVILHDTNNSFIKADNRLLSIIGLEDLVVVDTKDAILITKKSRAQDMNLIISKLKSQGRLELDHHQIVYRPWGHYETIDNGACFQVKRITVNPGAKLSLQKHQHRSEHWVVVTGLARVTKGEDTFLLSQNESTYIPMGELHSLENPDTELLEIIEIQTGDYLGEDDIIRVSDVYGRA